MEDFKNLLEEVAPISRENAEKAKIEEEKGERFNMFSVCGVGYERLNIQQLLQSF